MFTFGSVFVVRSSEFGEAVVRSKHAAMSHGVNLPPRNPGSRNNAVTILRYVLPMKAKIRGSLAVLVALVSAGSVLAHHSLANFDTTKAIRVKGTVVRFHKINPHSKL